MDDIKSMNIFQRMLAISTELDTIAKNLEIEAGKKTYKAVSEADVLRAVKPLESKYGVYSYPLSRDVIESVMFDGTDFKGNPKKNYFERIKTVYRFVNVDKPDEFIDQISFGDGLDSGDKSVGKAMTYSDKYSLLKGYKAVTGDDPDELDDAGLPVLDAKLLGQAAELKIDLNDLAVYLKKKINQLTNDDLSKGIEFKTKALNARKAKDEEPKGETNNG